MPRPALLLPALAALACKPPPPAPEGLQDSLTYLFRNFYAEDDVIGAGLTGFMDWVDGEGQDLLGKTANGDNVGEFTLDPLSTEDVSFLPIEGHVVLADAPGTVALSDLACDWKEAERYLVRTDQDIVFEEFDTYSRGFLTSRQVYEDATASGDFEPLREPFTEPYAPQPVLGDLERSFLFTDNQVSSTNVGVTLEFQLLLNLRHGIFEVQGEPTDAFLILTWLPERAASEGGDNSMEQSYSLELDVSRPDGQTMRLMSSWTQIESTLPDNVITVVGINKNLNSSARLADICAGEEDLPTE